MSFFLSQPADEPAREQLAEPLFRQNEQAHLSLSDYISRHLGEATVEAGSEASRASGRPSGAAGFRMAGVRTSSFRNAVPEGQRLNSLDVELAAGLEQYMPTPIFRLRVMKKRLDTEIVELHGRLNKYERLSDRSFELQERMRAIRERIGVLQAHEQAVSRELASLLRFGPFFYSLSRKFQDAGTRLGESLAGIRTAFARLLYGSDFLAMEAAGEQLSVLQELMAERLKDPSVPDAEISRLLNRYEQALHQSEEAARRATRSGRGGLAARLWQEAKRLVE